MKKYYLLFLMLFVFFVVPFNVLADEITNIEIFGFNEPVRGQIPKFSASVSDDANYIVTLEAWYGDNSTMLESKYNPSITNEIDVFKKDVVYTYSVYIKPKSGYSFADLVNAKIDGITLDNYRMAANTLVFEYEYGEARDVDFEISNVTMPVIFEKPIYTGEVPTGVNYKLYKELWYDENGEVLEKEFEVGKEYTYYALIKPNNNEVFNLPLYATVNGNLMHYLSNEGNLYVFTYKYIVDNNYTVVFDANKGLFSDNRKTYTIENWKIGDEKEIEKPVRKGYEFVGFFTEKIGGTSLEKYIAEAGIDGNMTFYAHWEEEIVNPDTVDNIGLYFGLVMISLVGFGGVFIYLKKFNN